MLLGTQTRCQACDPIYPVDNARYDEHIIQDSPNCDCRCDSTNAVITSDGVHQTQSCVAGDMCVNPLFWGLTAGFGGLKYFIATCSSIFLALLLVFFRKPVTFGLKKLYRFLTERRAEKSVFAKQFGSRVATNKRRKSDWNTTGSGDRGGSGSSGNPMHHNDNDRDRGRDRGRDRDRESRHHMDQYTGKSHSHGPALALVATSYNGRSAQLQGFESEDFREYGEFDGMDDYGATSKGGLGR